MRKVIVYIAMSLDGFIAKQDDDISFLSAMEEPGQDYGYGDFISTIDTVILGRRTYDKVLSFGIPFPHANKQTYVFTMTPAPSQPNLQFYNGDAGELINTLKQQPGSNIFIDGGAEIVHLFLQHQLVDELIISIIPVLLGSGISLFKQGRPQETLVLNSTVSFPKGLVQLHYTKTTAHI
jgi:dihydrofolate reductase